LDLGSESVMDDCVRCDDSIWRRMVNDGTSASAFAAIATRNNGPAREPVSIQRRNRCRLVSPVLPVDVENNFARWWQMGGARRDQQRHRLVLRGCGAD